MIRELRILPPFAIGRLGSAATPLANYTLEENPANPLDFRRIKPEQTFVIGDRTGEIVGAQTPRAITFKDKEGRIRPVAPFLEVFAVTDEDKLEPLTKALLRKEGLTTRDLAWNVTVGNRKVARRTGDDRDAVKASTGWFSTHRRQPLRGHCPNFVSREAYIDFGEVRYIRPNLRFPEIRLRFTPAKGLIYGPKLKGPSNSTPGEKIYEVPTERAVYDPEKGTWVGFQVRETENGVPETVADRPIVETMPPSLYAIEPPAPCWLHDNRAVSRGYFDDACDGIVQVKLATRDGRELEASARICAGPPAIVPDTLFLRTLADDLEQVIHGPCVPADEPEEVTRERAMDIVHRAFETVRFLNVAVMNGNPIRGRDPLLIDTMPAEEAFDVERSMRPVVPERTADTLAIMALHQQVYAALRSGAAPWFARVLRLPNEVGDYTDHGRRKMPAMMCGADGNYLALTWRQINTIFKAAGLPMVNEPKATDGTAVVSAQPSAAGLSPRNLSAQLNYVAAGNPTCTRPETSVGNCTPGLEVDFRAVWRRLFKGIVLREWDNLVMEMEPGWEKLGLPDLTGHRLMCVAGDPMVTTMIGPSPAGPQTRSVVLGTPANPEGAAPLEWSNALARVLHTFAGRAVECGFTRKAVWLTPVGWSGNPKDYKPVQLQVRRFFEPRTAVISARLAKPGELTQGLCSPWQNDYRECSCYYWASARPDFVNVRMSTTGASIGDNWLQKDRTGDYVADDYVDSRLLGYDDLFREWEKYLRFQIGGRDRDATE